MLDLHTSIAVYAGFILIVNHPRTSTNIVLCEISSAFLHRLWRVDLMARPGAGYGALLGENLMKTQSLGDDVFTTITCFQSPRHTCGPPQDQE